MIILLLKSWINNENVKILNMLVKYPKLNQFNKPTYGIKIDVIFELLINETDKGDYIIDFKEHMILYKKKLFTFTSSGDLRMVIKESMERAYSYFLGTEFNPVWSIWENKIEEVLSDFDYYEEYVKEWL